MLMRWWAEGGSRLVCVCQYCFYTPVAVLHYCGCCCIVKVGCGVLAVKLTADCKNCIWLVLKHLQLQGVVSLGVL
jgi:hypothetical protein